MEKEEKKVTTKESLDQEIKGMYPKFLETAKPGAIKYFDIMYKVWVDCNRNADEFSTTLTLQSILMGELPPNQYINTCLGLVISKDMYDGVETNERFNEIFNKLPDGELTDEIIRSL